MSNLGEIVQIVSSMGVTGFLVVAWYYARHDGEQAREEAKELNSKVLNVFTEHTKVVSQLRDVIDENTNVTKSMSDRLIDYISNGSRKNC